MSKIDSRLESDNSLKQRPKVFADRTRERFGALCDGLALEYSSGKLSLPDAVDHLQDWAMSRGLVEVIGQDAVQWIMTKAFLPFREDLADHGGR